jgi:hypothetical protein
MIRAAEKIKYSPDFEIVDQTLRSIRVRSAYFRR